MKKYHLLIMLFFAIFAPWTADAQSMLFSENFDGITAGNNVLPNNWQSINADNSSNCAYYPCVYANSQQTVYAYSGLNCLHFHSSSSAQVSDPQPQYAILPEMTDLAGKQITLYAKGENVSSTFKIGTMSAPTDASTFTLIAEQTLTESYQPFEYIVPSTCTDSYLAIMIEAANSDRTINGVYIDDIVINEAPSCLPPTALNAANITDNSAQLSWTANSGETAWTVYYRKGTDENYTNVLAETNPYILQGLDAASDYQYYVVANCSASFQSEPSGVFEFTTACAVVAAMGFQENFDSYQVTSGLSAPTVRVLPTCWSAINTTTDYNSVYPTIYNSSDAYYSTPNSLKFYSYYYSSTIYDPQPQYAILPEMTDLAGKQITLYAKGENASSTFKIGTMSDPTDASTFTLIAEQTLTNFYPTDPFEYLVPANCSDSYLAIMIDAATSSRTINGVYIDDIVIVEAPTCPKPTNLTVNSVTYQTAQLSWTSDITAWQICLNDDEDHLIDANTNSLFQLTGLTDGETYTAKVRANCGNDGYSQWSNEVSFTTLQACPAPTDLAVSGTTETQTTLTWTGTSESYDVMYRTAAYVDGFFEEFNTSNVPEGWTKYTGLLSDVMGGTATLSTTTFGWNFSNTNVFGAYHTKLNIYGTSCKYWLVTPNVNLANGSTLQFDLALTDYNSEAGLDVPTGQADDKFVVLITTDNMENWSILREWNNSGSEDIYNNIPNTADNHITIDLSAYNGQNVKIAFYGESTVEDGDNDLHIDNVGIGIAHVAGQWQTAAQQLENTTYTLAGLTPKTFYEVKVISNCENATSRETDPFGFSTLCGVITVDAANPFFEGFEGSNFPPTCWTLGDDVLYGNNSSNWGQWNSTAHTGRKSAFPLYGTVYLMMPNIHFVDDADVVQLTFWSYYDLNGEYNGSSVVLLDGENETELWTPNVNEIVSNTWYETTIDLTNYKNNQTISLAFKYVGENAHSWFLDDVEVKALYTYTKEIAPYDTNVYPTNGWHLIASPVVEPITPTAANGFLTNTYDLYRFNQTADSEWQNYKLHNSDENPFLLENGKGYLYANSGNNGNSPITLAFTGTPNIGSTQTVALDYSVDAQFVGVNLVGNPFPDTAYINRDFYTMNSDRTEIMTEASTNVAIPPMEGVFVIAAEEGEILTFSTTAFNGGQGALIALNLSQDRGVIDRAVIRFGEGHTLPKFQIRNNSTKVYIPMDNVDYAIVRSEGVGEMPVNFKAENNGTYMLSFTADEVTFNYLHLIDNKTGIDVDLLQTPSYTFNATTTDYTSRFRLVFSTGTQAESGTFAYFSNGNFVISNEGEATLQVVDVMGRILSNETINGSVSKAINIASGVYMLRLINGDNVKVQKIVVR